MTQRGGTIEERLLALQDASYRDFQAKLMPTVTKDVIIGVRTPLLRKLAKELSGTAEAEAFLQALPHRYYDENNLHGFLIAELRQYDRAIEAVEAFLPYVDNWATCDLLSPKAFRKNLSLLYPRIIDWLSSGETYTVRFGIDMLMEHFLGDAFTPDVLLLAAGVRSDEYYVNMAVAWLFATALAKRYEETLPMIERKQLDEWTHNKSIQKAVESYRISDEQKAYLKTFKIK